MKGNDHLEQLRSNMMGGDGQEEKVEVNQRHLIDKILARYSAEYVLYRELMQNADDASSTSVEIRFHSRQNAAEVSDTKRPPDLSVKCDKITFKNNGIPFRPEDWARLKRIAEGNPDEQKIGAFGVGFYSLFSVCENPFVFSGKQCMAFYFKGDQLFAKRADVAESDADDWTSFLMDLREPMELPDLEDFSKFLATSMGFTANLREITVYFDQHMIFSIKKRMAEPYNIPVDSKKMYTTSPQKMFTITGASMRQIQLDAEKYTPSSGIFQLATSLLSRREIDTSSGLPMEKASIFLRVVTGSLNVAVSREYEREMERATKKKPPKTTTYQLVYTGREELDASEKSTSSVFRRLLPFPHQGRIFIGFATHQTTGCCSHMAARFIPTVERESIDFADRYISIWNKELLAVGGLLCRIVYDNEMTQIERLYRELVGERGLVDKSKEAESDGPKHMLEKRAAHALRSFTFQPSTPNAIVGRVQEQLFFQSSKVPARIMTSHGIQPVTSARILDGQHMASSIVDPFVKTIPTIPEYIMTECKESMDKFKSFSLLRPLGLDDILKELDTRSLSESEMVFCMKWWIEYSKATNYGHVHPKLERFLNAAILDCDGKRFLPLASFKSWINPKLIPLDMPVPETTLPFSVSKGFDPNLLQQFFGNWTELSLLDWIRFIASKQEIQTSAPFAEKVLSVLSRGFRHISSRAQTEVSTILKDKKCIPTKYGMKTPVESYFPTVNLFDDLPIVHFENPRAVSDQVLTVLGVRKHVDLQLVFDRLISDGSWSHVDLVKYLTTVQGTLSSVEIGRLKETAIFTKEGEQPRMKEVERKVVDANGNTVMEKHQKKIYRRYKAKELFTPTETLRELKLPLIDWNGRWRQASDEAKFLETLGLQSFPPLPTLLTLASPATNDRQVQLRALRYFVENEKQYADVYDVMNIDIAFLPCWDGKTYAAPKDCFSNPQVKLLDFNVLHQDLIPIKDKLLVRENPDPERLLDAFMTHITKDQKKAQKMFEYLASRMGDFRLNHWQLLRQTKFIPVTSQREGEGIVLVEPTHCYFESEGSSFHKELFTYVDFGEKANMFLRSCGVKDEPTTTELAAMIVKDPARFWNLSGGGERYLSVLRQIAGQFEQIRSDRSLLQEMKNSPFLVGIKRSRLTQHASEETSKIIEETNPMDEFIQYQLAKATDIFVIDDTMSQQIFSPLSAPMEQLLEEFYSSLGSRRLSSQIKETYTYRDVMGVTERSKAITEAIFERTPIIIYQMLSDNPQRQKELYHDEKYVKNNLKVVQARELKIKRQFKHTGEENVQSTTAWGGRSSFTIYISGTGEIDYYDVANALCTLLFTHVRFNDAIVVERYLTASLTSLKRKGVPVDRILNIRKNIESAPAPSTPPVSRQPTPMPTLTPSQLDQYTNKILDVFGDCEKGYIRQLLSQERENHLENVINRLLQEGYPSQQGDVQDDSVQQKPKDLPTPSEQKRGTRLLDRIWSWNRTTTTTKSPTLPESPKPETESPPQTPQVPRLPPSEGTITPNYMSNIRQNLKRGIHSCKAFSGQDIYSPPQLNNVKESHSYCDATPQQNLVSAGQAMGMQFFVHRDVDPDDVRKQYGAAMGRFSSVISVLAQVFGLKPSAIHIFYDTNGGTVAFNRSGSIFLNLRYYLALHDSEDTSAFAAKRKEGLIYWFMTLCHELAHNFVSEHSSEHEFYMSSFAEVYLEGLVPYLTPSSNGQ